MSGGALAGDSVERYSKAASICAATSAKGAWVFMGVPSWKGKKACGLQQCGNVPR
jgi:hypothetical protein